MKKTSIVVGCVLSMGVEAADFKLTWGAYIGSVGHNIVAFCGINNATPYQVVSVSATRTVATVALPVSAGDAVRCHLRALRLSDLVYSDPSVPVQVAALSGAVADQPPVAKPGGPYNTTLGSTVVFNGNASADPERQPLTYDWNFGDGSTHGTGIGPSYIYSRTGTYTVTLVVNDGGASSAPASTTVTIGDVNASTNLIVNAGFETGFKNPWTGGGGMTNAAADIRSGTWAYRVWGSTTQWPDIRQDVTVVAGKTYDFSGWMRITGKTATSSSSGNYYTFQIHWYDASGTETGTATSFGTSYSNIAYTRFSQQAVAPTGAVKGRLHFLAAQADGTGYIDDLSIVALP
ncbi:MAG: PKD domain-containing protein [Gammaproteobacteria bacterium]|nr:MAG: PKD domain-containing protein [Gammaproteobacteria bacterium]TND02169.1 MAG: PKD domain-containing protein [Gammaproteobacteria bacterium]